MAFFFRNKMKVLKFGGTSVGSADSIKQVAKIVKSGLDQGDQIVVVSSAMGGVTNHLIEASQLAKENDDQYLNITRHIETRHAETIRQLLDARSQSKSLAHLKMTINELEEVLHGVSLIRELSERTLDLVLSFGERLSVPVLATYFQQEKINAVPVDSRELIFTNNDFGHARVDYKPTNQALKDYFKNLTSTPIVTGFIASGENKETTTLGRGGSDFTAAIIGAALGAAEIEIWTDVDGVMSTDPKVVKNACSLSYLSYLEAMEMSHFGAKVIHPPSLQPAFNEKILLRIKNTFNPAFPGTVIGSEPKNSVRLIKGISSIKQVTLISLTGSGMVGVPGVSSRLFSALAAKNISVILITQASSEHSICFAINPDDAKAAKKVIRQEFEFEMERGRIDAPLIEPGKSIIAIIGENMRNTPGISGKLFSALGRNGINATAIAQGSSEVNISVVIDEKNLSKSLNAVHQAFFLSESKTLNLFMVGVGLIGGTLLKQIKAQAAYLLNERLLEINVIALSNTKKMIFDENGINLDQWKEQMENSAAVADLTTFVKEMVAMNLPNSIFVDNTSNLEITGYYQKILAASISVVTPNKLANSGRYADYQLLQKEAFLHGVKFLYETNVGAGLPVIGTMADLKFSGDKILKIEGVLSGTLSYIFNNFKGETKFSDVVLEAKNSGFTEPDPRDDLNGMDVARKILILARESGVAMEPENVEIENILPQSCLEAASIDLFFKALEKNNAHFDTLKKDAEKAGKKLRFIATLENSKATVQLKAVDQDHPFFSLSGSDNIIAFTTLRYHDRPLVIKGPGAGAEVTAAGVFAEIISISNYLYQGIKNILPNNHG